MKVNDNLKKFCNGKHSDGSAIRCPFLRAVSALAAMALAVSTTSAAEPTAEPAYMDSVVGLDEVSVTAIKSTAVSQFPAATTNIGPALIENLDIQGLKGASEIAPNFYMPKYGSRMTSTIYVRGLGTRIDQPVVALNIDNVQILNKDNFDFDFPDIQRIEMVRGAQSILYGRNSMGGVINISTLSPLQFQGFRATAEYGSGNTWRTDLSYYFKPYRTLGLAVVASMNSTDGFFRNEYTGRKIDNERQGLAKTKLSWRPSDNFILENNAWISLLRQGGYAYESVESGKINHNDTCFYRRTTVIDGLTMRYMGENLSVSSITAFQYHNDNMTLDQDFLPEDYFTLSQRRHEWSVTQDFVAKGQVGNYIYLGGLYGFCRRYNMNAPVTFKDYGLQTLVEANINAALPAGMMLKWDDRNMVLGSRFMSPVWGWAVYHQSEYSYGRLTASLGLRLAYERTDFSYNSEVHTSATMYRQAGPNLIPLATAPINMQLKDKLSTSSLQLLPELKLSYDIGSGMGIGVVLSKGYKSGGFNTQIFSDVLQKEMMANAKPQMGGRPAPGAMPGDSAAGSEAPKTDISDIVSYKPETSWNYEIDFTASLPCNLDLEASVFYIDCRNQQMTVFPDEAGTGRMMANAGRTRSIGTEISATYRPTDDITLRATYGSADAKFVRFDDGRRDYRGNYVPYAPQNTLFASASWRLPVRSSFLREITPSLNCRGVGRIYWNEANDLSQPFYAQLGCVVTFAMPKVDIDLWGENLTGTRFSTFYFESVGHRFLQRGTPRRIGATVRVRIGK